MAAPAREVRTEPASSLPKCSFTIEPCKGSLNIAGQPTVGFAVTIRLHRILGYQTGNGDGVDRGAFPGQT